MEVYHFTEFPYPHLPPDDQFTSMRVNLPSRVYDPKIGADLYNMYLDQHMVADDLGFLLLGEAEDLLDAGTEPGVGGTLLLTDLPVRIRQFLLEGLDLVTVLTQIGFELVEVLVGWAVGLERGTPRSGG